VLPKSRKNIYKIKYRKNELNDICPIKKVIILTPKNKNVLRKAINCPGFHWEKYFINVYVILKPSRKVFNLLIEPLGLSK
jgi:hypothetical protein